ncbi:MAG: hypothetical protein ABSD80_16085 [Caulobacteraceae bacterium]|jgi:predicted ATPase with chaperone activity
MFIGDILVAQNLVTREDVADGLAVQRYKGGSLGDSLVELGRISPEVLAAAVQAVPASPHTVADTGLSLSLLLNLMMKAMHVVGVDTPSAIGELLKLPPRAVQELLDEAGERKLINVLGAVGAGLAAERCYSVSMAGAEWALAAMRQCKYIGPAPVTLAAFREQIRRQGVSKVKINHGAIDRAFGDMVISEELVCKIGPAINSARSILLYGPPGNGKSSIATRIGSLFKDVIYIPYCFEVDGQIITVFDPTVHQSVQETQDAPADDPVLRREDFDPRWEACSRPVIMVGGELTLEMLDLGYNSESGFCEAPLHIKALGGVFVIDDFGRQLVKPEALLNRWIVPLEGRIDYLKLNTGKSFPLPFDELVIFSTNLSPSDLMDPAFLRRIPYKIGINAPSVEEYRDIFRKTAERAGVEVTDAMVDHIICEINERNGIPLAGYQPTFIIDQVLAACQFMELEPQIQPRFVAMALNNLYTEEDRNFGDVARLPRRKAVHGRAATEADEPAALAAA